MLIKYQQNVTFTLAFVTSGGYRQETRSTDRASRTVCTPGKYEYLPMLLGAGQDVYFITILRVLPSAYFTMLSPF